MSRVITPCVAIAGITTLEVVAICKGLDGAYFSLVMIAIAGIGGFELSKAITEVRNGNKNTKT